MEVTKRAMRPNSVSDVCFYCKQPIGADHLDTCVLIQRKVRVTLKPIVLDVPASWSEAEIIEYLEGRGFTLLLDELDSVGTVIVAVAKSKHVELNESS